jgi:hypothetical protein
MVDIKDVPRDPALPWLPAALDGEAMRRRLQPHFGPQVEILQVKVGRFTYKPGRSVRLAYRLKLLDRDRALKSRHVLHGRMEPAAEIAHQHRKTTRRTWVTPRYGPAVLFLADLDLLLYGFPNDPQLAGIGPVSQPEQLLELLADKPAVAAFAPVACQSTAVKYVPGKRLVMRHRLSNAAGRHLLVYSKTYGHDGGAAIHAVMEALWDASQGDPEAFACPEPIAWLPEQRSLFLRALPGTAALAALDATALPARMARAGHGLARIHTSRVAGLASWSEADERQNFVKALGMLRRHDAELGPRGERLAALVSRGLAAVEPLAPAPIHTAFRYSQLLEYRDRLALVDFDGFRQGHPMCDVGSFVAHLLYLNAKGELSETATRAAVDAFLSGYQGLVPWGLPPGALHWYAAVILTSKHAQKCVKRLKDDLEVKIRQMLETAERILDGRLRLC